MNWVSMRSESPEFWMTISDVISVYDSFPFSEDIDISRLGIFFSSGMDSLNEIFPCGSDGNVPIFDGNELIFETWSAINLIPLKVESLEKSNK